MERPAGRGQIILRVHAQHAWIARGHGPRVLSQLIDGRGLELRGPTVRGVWRLGATPTLQDARSACRYFVATYTEVALKE